MAGLMERQLFSTKSFDLDPLAIRALIRRIAQTVHGPPAQAKALLLADFRLASVHDLAAILKWALARLIRSSPPSTSSPTPTATATPADRRPRRGLVDWQAYLTWRAYEHGASHAPQAFQAFLSPLPPSTAALLDRLFHLLARTLAFAVHNGNSAPRLAALFAPLLFGLAPDMAFHPTYDAYCKIANATQHLLLAYVRYQAELDSQRGIHPSLIIQVFSFLSFPFPPIADPIFRTSSRDTIIPPHARFTSRRTKRQIRRCCTSARTSGPMRPI